MIPLGLLVVEAAFLAAAHAAGGPPWTVVAAACFAVLGIAGRRQDDGWRRSVWLMLPSLGWLAAFWASGNRELFFPFAMYLAAHATLTVSHRGPVATWLAGGLIVVAFLAIRALQAATPRVLAVEAVAAGAILTLTCLAVARRERSLPADGLILGRLLLDGLILAAASAAAFVSLGLPS